MPQLGRDIEEKIAVSMYDLKYGKDTLTLLKSWIADLSIWSVYNDDAFNEEIFEMKQLAKRMEQKLSTLPARTKSGEVDCSCESKSFRHMGLRK